MIATIATWLIARNPAMTLGYARRLSKFILIGAGVLVVILAACAWLWQHDKGVIREHEQARELEAGAARETAANERLTDTIANAKSEQELHDAINNAPAGGEISPAALALSCERLRKLGRLPPACRREGGDGSQANPD